jgi:hypothetical protein
VVSPQLGEKGMPKSVDFCKLVMAIGRMAYSLELSLLRQLNQQVQLCQSASINPDQPRADLWNLFQKIPANLRKEFAI